MKITIKNLKICNFASEETLCYEATVYIDGVRAFTAHNDGHGGCDMYRAVDEKGRALLEQAERWAGQQDAISSSVSDSVFSFIPDLEYFVQKEIADLQIQKEVKRDMKANLVGYVDGQIFTWKIPPSHPTGREIVLAKKPNVQFLNDMPIEQAVNIYRRVLA